MNNTFPIDLDTIFSIKQTSGNETILRPDFTKIPVTETIKKLSDVIITLKPRKERILIEVDYDDASHLMISKVPEILPPEEVGIYLRYLEERFFSHLSLQIVLSRLSPMIDRELYYPDIRRDLLLIVCNPLRKNFKVAFHGQQIICQGISLDSSDLTVLLQSYRQFVDDCEKEMIAIRAEAYCKLQLRRENELLQQAIDAAATGNSSWLHYVLLLIKERNYKLGLL